VGVRGIRPPAVREEKSPVWDLRGVDTDAVAMVADCAAAVSMTVDDLDDTRLRSRPSPGR
jgi:hypothetical protein